MPNADLLYLGDTKNLPYGEKPPSLLRRYADAAFSFFEKHSVSALVVACGTVSSTVLESEAPPIFRFPIFGVVRPAAELALSSGFRRIAVLATEATIRSGVYGRLLSRGDAEVLPLACQALVSLAERGAVSPEDRQLVQQVARLLSPLRGFCPDAIVLGCTHFPLFSEIIRGLFPKATQIDCGRTAVDALPPRLCEVGSRSTSYYVTGSASLFSESAGIDARVSVHEIKLSHTG